MDATDDDSDDLDTFMNSLKANTRSIRQSSTPSKTKKRSWHQNPTDDFISNTSSDENNPDQLFDFDPVSLSKVKSRKKTKKQTLQFKEQKWTTKKIAKKSRYQR